MVGQPSPTTAANFGWAAIARLGLVQMALGAIVVLMTSTLNRVMVVELALPALVPGLLVGLHYAMQFARPRMGFGSDLGGRRTPWILGGMAVLGAGAVLAAVATAWMGSDRWAGMALAVLAFVLIGLGVAAAGTSLLVLLAKRVAPDRRAPAATLVWMMMILGFALSAGTAGKLLDPYTPQRLIWVCACVVMAALLLAALALWRLEGPAATGSNARTETRPHFATALRETWAEPAARHFTIFVFVSMLAFSAQDLILEPFAGLVFGLTPGQTTALSGMQNGGVFAGMLLAALAGRGIRGHRFGSLAIWTVGGCIASALALLGLVVGAMLGSPWPIEANVFVLGVANGAFSIAAIGSMMRMAGEGRERREGVRMGLWGAAQAIAFGCGGTAGAVASDLAKLLVSGPALAYALVFAAEALLFLAAAQLARGIAPVRAAPAHPATVVEPGVQSVATSPCVSSVTPALEHRHEPA
jgi:BCD family chlorophyll transporter-like MFS transporter